MLEVRALIAASNPLKHQTTKALASASVASRSEKWNVSDIDTEPARSRVSSCYHSKARSVATDVSIMPLAVAQKALHLFRAPHQFRDSYHLSRLPCSVILKRLKSKWVSGCWCYMQGRKQLKTECQSVSHYFLHLTIVLENFKDGRRVDSKIFRYRKWNRNTDIINKIQINITT